MTEKQEKILKSALELFATEGFHAVSTSKIARHAGVSEALIFRHFEHKEGLLAAILEHGKAKLKNEFADIVMSTDPKEVLRKILELPYNIPDSEYEVWRLTYALKWQTGRYDDKMLEPVKMAVTNAFKKLGVTNPEAEMDLLMMILDGTASALLLHEPANKHAVKKLLLEKYGL